MNWFKIVLLLFAIILFIIQCVLVGYQMIKTYECLFIHEENENGKR